MEPVMFFVTGCACVFSTYIGINYTRAQQFLSRSPSTTTNLQSIESKYCASNEQGPSLRVLSRGKKKGLERAEEMLLSGKSLLEVGSIFEVSLATLRKYIPGGIGGLKAKYPNLGVYS
jgi:hypothetical protein